MSEAESARSSATPRPDENAVRVPHWMMAALLMFALHLLWLIWLVPSPTLYRAPPRVPLRVTFLTGAVDGQGNGQDPNGDARILWSPILLSLPTPMGFSGSVVSEDLDVQPTLDAPLGSARFLDRDDYAPPLPDPGRHLRDLHLSPAVLTDPVPPPAELPAPAPGLAILPVGDRAGPRLVHTPWPDGEEAVGAGADWQLTARLAFDPGGTVTEAMIDVPADDAAVNRLAAHFLRQWRAAPAREGGSLQVVLSYTAGPAPALPDAGGAP